MYFNTSLQNRRVTDGNCTTVENKTTDDATLNAMNGSTAHVFTTNVTGLFPDVNYTLRVYPYNEAGVGLHADKPLTTNQERKLVFLEEGYEVFVFCY